MLSVGQLRSRWQRCGGKGKDIEVAAIRLDSSFLHNSRAMGLRLEIEPARHILTVSLNWRLTGSALMGTDQQHQPWVWKVIRSVGLLALSFAASEGHGFLVSLIQTALGAKHFFSNFTSSRSQSGYSYDCVSAIAVIQETPMSRENNPIGLAELIERVKQELLAATPGSPNKAPLLCVDSVELELQVTVRREGKAGIKIDVVSVGGGELGGGASRDEIQTVKVKLSPLFDKERLMEFYQTLHSDKVPAMVKQSLDALLKGEQGEQSNLADRY